MITSREGEVDNIFGINRCVEIEVRGKDSTDRYRSRVEDVNRDTMALAMPMRHTNLVRLPEGHVVAASVVEIDALYSVKGTVLSNLLQPVPLLIIRVEGGIERLQRRRYLRIATYLKNNNVLVMQGEQKEWETLVVPVLSLSAGGLLFKTDRKIIVGTDLQIELNLGDGMGNPIRVCARVTRAQKEEERKSTAYSIGCRFTSIRAADEKRIVRYTFRMQIELSKRRPA